MANDQIHVDLKPPSGTDGWMMKVDAGGWTAGPQYPSITVGYNHKADITFAIQNATGQNATFAANPILVPAKEKVFDNPVINSPTSFTITDKNPSVDHGIPYVLLFTNAPKLDPIIDNDGGGHLVEDLIASSASMFIAGAVIGAILVLALRAMFGKRSRVER